MNNIILIGLPGSGKTTLGMRLSKQTGLEFIDLDEHITATSGTSINDIFAQHGEPYFRDLETRVLTEALKRDKCIIATGGGIVLRDENVKLMRQNGLVVFNDRPVENITSDIKIGSRPLLKDGVEKLMELDKQRREIYLKAAHLILPNNGGLEKALEILGVCCGALSCGEYTVIGDPIGHSLSPPIHNAVFMQVGVSESYGSVHVKPGSLEAFVAAAKAFGIKGFNITHPHKQDIIPMLDSVNGDAKLCSSVNTVVNVDGKLHGYNTDMQGLNLSLRGAGHSYTGRRLMLLGAGGAAAAVALKAATEGVAEMYILNRNLYRSSELAETVEARTGFKAAALGFSEQELITTAKQCDLVINSTPLGMSGKDSDFESLEFLKYLDKKTLVCDLIYNPPKTKLLLQSEKLGLDTLNGLGMLIYQAILADEFYIDKELDKQQLYGAVVESLK